MKGIIDSDDEDAQPFKPQQGDSEDDEASTDEEEEEEDFIVEDNGDIDEEELARAERLMPSEFDIPAISCSRLKNPAHMCFAAFFSSILEAWCTHFRAAFLYICGSSWPLYSQRARC